MSGLFLVWRSDGEAIVITAADDDDGCSSWLDDDSGADCVCVGSGVMHLFMIAVSRLFFIFLVVLVSISEIALPHVLCFVV